MCRAFVEVTCLLTRDQVTLALVITGSQPIVRSALILISQLTGSIAASALALGVFQTLTPVRTSPAEGVSIPRSLFIEAILTAQLVLVILLFARDKQAATAGSPVVIGLTLFACELVAIFWTGGSLNPARSFGPNVVSWTWNSTHWIYWAGPLLGSLLAVVVLRVLQALAAEMSDANDGVHAHASPPCQYPAVFPGGYFDDRAMKQFDASARRNPPPQNAESDLTGVISLWQTKGVGRYRGNSVVRGPSAHHAGHDTSYN